MEINSIRENKNTLPPRSHSPRSKLNQKIISASTVALSVAVLASGCVVAPDPTPSPGEAQNSETNTPKPNPPNGEDNSQSEVIASTITTTTALGNDLQIDVHALERLENKLLRLRIGVTNKSGERFTLFDGLSEKGDPNTASQISLIDTDNHQRYLSYDQSNGKCFCSTLAGSAINKGETVEMWVMYPEPPLELQTMTITTPLTPPLLDVPISVSSESVENEGLADAKILDLTMISDNLEDQTGRTENNEEVSIILSSDVLFETNSSDLSPDAQEILEQVAIEINDASSTTVSIDGHADNTGSDSINLPLSQERAESVETVLADMITRNGITFEVEGHGSNKPIADNSTEEGRERNRRVSVTFEK